MKSESHRIDVHYHIIPEPYVAALRKRGIQGSTYVPFPRWTPDRALSQLDRDGIGTAVTSLSTPGVWFGEAPLARTLSRLCNEFQARMVSNHPERFGSLATLPLPDVEGALRELEYALDDLGHDGVCLLSDAGGRYLGDPEFEELFAELDRRKAVVFIHPTDDPLVEKRYELFSPLLEWCIHTTRAAMDLLYSGRLARYPGIRFILAHGGGALPYLAYRTAAVPSRGPAEPAQDCGAGPESFRESREKLAQLTRLFFDTASPDEAHLAALQRFGGPEQLLFGTDGGWTPPVQTALTIRTFLAYDGFSPDQLQAIERGTAESLFPRLAGGREAPDPEGSGSRVGPPPEIRPTAPSRALDVHHHMLPPFYLAALEEEGIQTGTFPTWRPERSLGAMDRTGVERALLSLSSPGVWLGDDWKARRLARKCNEYAASLKAEHPSRFGALATLPFPDLQGSLEELDHSLDVLHLDGVLLFSSVAGRYVGDREFDPLLATLHEKKALVLLHPNHLPPGHPDAAIHAAAEYPIDVARSYARLVLNDAFLRYPDIRWILGHAGGVVPFMAHRLGKAHYVNGEKGRLNWWRILKDLLLKGNSGLALAKGIGYDTAAATDPVIAAALGRLVEPGRVHFGSNFPWDPPRHPGRQRALETEGEAAIR